MFLNINRYRIVVVTSQRVLVVDAGKVNKRSPCVMPLVPAHMS